MRNFEATFDAKTKTLELRLFGVVGEDVTGDGSTIDATAVAQALAVKPTHIRAIINSRGGSVFHGLAIYELLKTSGAHVSGQIVGLCGSIMSVIAAACDVLEMNSAALMMIHEASGAVAGRASEMRMTAEITDKMNDSQVDIFTARTGQAPEAIRAMLSAETWMTAREALAGKFITGISSAKIVAAEFNENQFTNVPAHVLPLLADLQAKGAEPMAEESTTAPEKDANSPDDFATWSATPEAQDALKNGYAGYLRTAADSLETESPAEDAKPDEETEPTDPTEPPMAKADVEKIKAEARAEERTRQTTITELCAQAKLPELSAKFCESAEITVADVRTKLFEALCKERGPLGDEGGTAGDTKATANANDKYVAEFKAEASYAKAMTEAEYIAMRRIDDGHDTLKIGPTK